MLKRLFLLVVLALVIAVPSAAQAAPIPGQYIVVLKPGADRAAMARYARLLGADVFMQYQYALKGFAVRLPEAAISTIQRNPNVLFLAPDDAVNAAAACSSQSQCVPIWDLRTGADQSTAHSGDGTGAVDVNVAVLDSGIDATHPDLNVAGGTNCVNDKRSDPAGHGTAVAGVIGARDNGFGVVGIAPGSRLWDVRVLDRRGAGTVSQLVCGVDWVTATRTDADPMNDIAVANMSIEGKGSDDANCGRTKKDALHLAICASVTAGVTYVAAAGNGTTDIQTITPAAYEEVLTATAIADYDGQPGGLAASGCVAAGADDSAAIFSNFATLTTDQSHTVAAPGVCIASTFPGASYASFSGTSFAAPIVAGTVALCDASGTKPCAGLRPSQIMQKIIGDAAAYNTANPAYGFQGDPLRPISGKYYGYLIRAGLY